MIVKECARKAEQPHQNIFTIENTECIEFFFRVSAKKDGDVGAFDGQGLRDPLKRPKLFPYFHGRAKARPYNVLFFGGKDKSRCSRWFIYV